MSRSQSILIFIWTVTYLDLRINCYRFEPNTFTFNNMSECPGSGNNSVHANYNVTLSSRNKFYLDGVILFEETLTNQLDLQIIAQRCDFNRTNCEIFDTFNVRDICRLMDLTDQLWSGFMTQTEPKIKCPIKKSVIKVKDGLIDLGYIAHLPMGGYIWIFTFKVFHTKTKARIKKHIIFCLECQMTCKKERPERRKTTKSRRV